MCCLRGVFNTPRVSCLGSQPAARCASTWTPVHLHLGHQWPLASTPNPRVACRVQTSNVGTVATGNTGFFVRPFQSLPIQLHYNVFEASVTTGFFIFILASSVATIFISPDPVRMQVWTSNKLCQISWFTSVQWSVGIQFSCSVNLSRGSPLPKAVSLLSSPTIYPPPARFNRHPKFKIPNPKLGANLSGGSPSP